MSAAELCPEHNPCARITLYPITTSEPEDRPLLEAAVVVIACLREPRPAGAALETGLSRLAACLTRRLAADPDPERPRRLEAIRRELLQPGSTRARLEACWGAASPLLPRLLTLAAAENPLLAVGVTAGHCIETTNGKEV